MPMASWASIFDVVPLPGPERERDYNIGIIGICHICQFMGLKSPWEASGTQEWQWKSPIHRVCSHLHSTTKLFDVQLPCLITIQDICRNPKSWIEEWETWKHVSIFLWLCKRGNGLAAY